MVLYQAELHPELGRVVYRSPVLLGSSGAEFFWGLAVTCQHDFVLFYGLPSRPKRGLPGLGRAGQLRLLFGAGILGVQAGNFAIVTRPLF